MGKSAQPGARPLGHLEVFCCLAWSSVCSGGLEPWTELPGAHSLPARLCSHFTGVHTESEVQGLHLGSMLRAAPLHCPPQKVWGWDAGPGGRTWPRSLSRASAFQRRPLHLMQRPQGRGRSVPVPGPGGEWLLPTDGQVNLALDGHSSPRPLLSLSPPLRACLGATGLGRGPKISAGSLRAASGCVRPPDAPAPRGATACTTEGGGAATGAFSWTRGGRGTCSEPSH